MSILDDGRLPITCPECGHKFEQRVGRLRADPEFTCPGCGKLFKADKAVSQLDQITKPLDDLVRRGILKRRK